MLNALIAVLSIGCLSLGVVSFSLQLGQTASAASGALLFHLTNIPVLGQDIIIKVTDDSGKIVWQSRYYAIPLLSNTITERISGVNSGKLLSACITTIYGSSKKVSGCNDAEFDPAGGTDFFLSLSSKPRQFN